MDTQERKQEQPVAAVPVKSQEMIRTRRESMQVELESYSHNEQLARVMVAAYMTRLNPTVEETEDVKTAVSEAVTNAIIHGYQESGERLILRVSSFGDELQIEVEDFGVGILDVEQAMQPLYTTCVEDERSGMGFTFMETFMDQVEVRSTPGSGTLVTMKKKIGVGERIWTKQQN